MRIRMLSTAAGPDGVWAEGSVQNVPRALALPLLEAGYAVALEDVNLASTSSASEPTSATSEEQAVVEPETPEDALAAEEQAILAPLEVASRKRRKGR